MVRITQIVGTTSEATLDTDSVVLGWLFYCGIIEPAGITIPLKFTLCNPNYEKELDRLLKEPFFRDGISFSIGSEVTTVLGAEHDESSDEEGEYQLEKEKIKDLKQNFSEMKKFFKENNDFDLKTDSEYIAALRSVTKFYKHHSEAIIEEENYLPIVESLFYPVGILIEWLEKKPSLPKGVRGLKTLTRMIKKLNGVGASDLSYYIEVLKELKL